MALRMVRGPRREPAKPTAQKSRAEYLVACLREEANDPKFSDWERDFIVSLARQVGQGRKLSEKQEEIIERLWDKRPGDVRRGARGLETRGAHGGDDRRRCQEARRGARGGR